MDAGYFEVDYKTGAVERGTVHNDKQTAGADRGFVRGEVTSDRSAVMLNVSRTLHRILVVAACLMFAEALAVPIPAAAQAAGNLAQRRAGAPQFVCNQAIGLTLTREWYDAGFEQAPGISDDRWQLKARQSAYITEWSNPTVISGISPPQSPCANGSASPDHVVLTVLS